MSEQFEGFDTPGTTAVPDYVFDFLLKILTGNELKVLMYIIRRTFGFGKNADAISLSQFKEGIKTKEGKVLNVGCGIGHNRLILASLKGLEKKGCIVSEKREAITGSKDTTIYKLRFKKAIEVVTSGNEVVTQSNQGGSYFSARGVVTSGNIQETHVTRNTTREGVVVTNSSDTQPKTPSLFSQDAIINQAELSSSLEETHGNGATTDQSGDNLDASNGYPHDSYSAETGNAPQSDQGVEVGKDAQANPLQAGSHREAVYPVAQPPITCTPGIMAVEAGHSTSEDVASTQASLVPVSSSASSSYSQQAVSAQPSKQGKATMKPLSEQVLPIPSDLPRNGTVAVEVLMYDQPALPLQVKPAVQQHPVLSPEELARRQRISLLTELIKDQMPEVKGITLPVLEFIDNWDQSIYGPCSLSKWEVSSVKIILFRLKGTLKDALLIAAELKRQGKRVKLEAIANSWDLLADLKPKEVQQVEIQVGNTTVKTTRRPETDLQRKMREMRESCEKKVAAQ